MTCHIRQRQISALWMAALGIALMGFSANAQFGNPANHIITFDAPGAGTGANQGTYVNRIVDSGAVTGWYIDSNDVHHGFIRTPDGVITKVDAPRA